VRKYFIS